MALQAKYSSLYPLLSQPQPQIHSSNSLRTIRIVTSCSHHKIQVQVETMRTKKKLKPSFFEQIRHKWSFKISSPREKLPWEQEEQEQAIEQEEVKSQLSFGVTVAEPETDMESPMSDPVSSALPNTVTEPETDIQSPMSDPVSSALPNRFSAPWAHGNAPTQSQFGFQPKISQISAKKKENANGLLGLCGNNVVKQVKNLDNEGNCNEAFKKDIIIDANPAELSRDKPVDVVGSLNGVISVNGKLKDTPDVVGTINRVTSVNEKLDESKGFTGTNWLPWLRDVENERDRRKRSNTELAERMIPEHELRRLRNVSLRMLERIKVGNAGITQALVDSIHEKWKIDEVVKLKFEEPHSLNMKRTHEILESRTGGLVIWRSGSSAVLFRGMAYKLPCVQSFTKQNQIHQTEDVASNFMHNVGENNLVRTSELFKPSAKYLQNLSEEELIDLSELNYLLDELGPRFKDWPGCEPLPVDADLLPPVVPGYKPPFRLLPHGVRHCLRDTEVTMFRRLARKMPPHFALGRNRELQGLAKAMVKLWEKNAIAKIAIKRGVLNTCNERMAEELKKLTGGTLLSRNKDYIVFYRGNDFLSPVLMEALKERLKLTDIQQNEEEQARQAASALVESKATISNVPLVAGTLAETIAATSRWGNQPNSKDVEEMLRDSALTRHSLLVKYLEKKLVLAKRKLKRAEMALAEVQGNLDPAELPSDVETISNEERFLFRKMGLSMKPYLLLGRRGVYDGTIENMHLHWKFRELVKIIVRGKSLAQVKQIGISLEAESGGVLVSLDKTTKGYAIVVYRGKNYISPLKLRPKNLLTRRQALARSIELQRREALKHHVLDLEERIELVKSELEDMNAGNIVDVEKSLCSRLDDACFSDDDTE